MTRHVGLIALLGLAGAGVVHAQASDPPSVGQRVRIQTSSAEKPLVGTLRQVDERTLLVDDGNGAFTSVPTTDVRKIELSTGRHSNVTRGAIIGASVGVALAVGAIIAVCDDTDCTYGRAVTALGLGGAATGALVGAPIKTERWRSVPLDGVRSRIEGPRSQLSVTLRF